MTQFASRHGVAMDVFMNDTLGCSLKTMSEASDILTMSNE
jgi:hypothetical protein